LLGPFQRRRNFFSNSLKTPPAFLRFFWEGHAAAGISIFSVMSGLISPGSGAAIGRREISSVSGLSGVLKYLKCLKRIKPPTHA
jgi:hypothetical protein